MSSNDEFHCLVVAAVFFHIQGFLRTQISQFLLEEAWKNDDLISSCLPH